MTGRAALILLAAQVLGWAGLNLILTARPRTLGVVVWCLLGGVAQAAAITGALTVLYALLFGWR